LIFLAGCLAKRQSDFSVPSSVIPKEKAVELGLLGPFSLLNGPENIEKERLKTDEWQVGELVQEQGNRLAVSLKIRGNNSIEECLFRKLKLKWDKALAELNPLGTKSHRLKIGTHCQKIDGQTKLLGNELSPVRENFLLQLYGLLSEYSLKSRLARVNYTDSLDNQLIGTYFAILREDEDEFAKRNGLSTVVPEESAVLANYDLESLAILVLFQSLSGNPDWRVAGIGGEPFGPQGVWNTEVYRKEGGGEGQLKLIPVPSDLDIARTLVLLDKASLGGGYWISKNITNLALQPSVIYSVEMLLRNFNALPPTALAFAIGKFQMIEQHILTLYGLLDDDGRQFFRRHINDFSRALSTIKSMVYIPSGTIGKDFEGKICTVRGNSIVFSSRIDNAKATVFVPFDDGEIPFCIEGTTPREGLIVNAEILIGIKNR
jgi:hypothetical protein